MCYHTSKIVESGAVWSSISILLIQLRLQEGNLTSNLSKGTSNHVCNPVCNNLQNNYPELKINASPMKSTIVGASCKIKP